MKPCYFESLILIRINFPEDDEDYLKFINLKNDIRKKIKQFGFDMYGIDSCNDDTFECYSKDNLIDLIIQRSKFTMKSLRSENMLEILDFKIKSVLVDSNISDEIFPLNKK